MRVLIACEFSGVVRDAFAERGHDAWSCDLVPSERGGKHLISNSNTHLLEIIVASHWDMLLCFWPCTFLCNSGVRWLYGGNGLIPEANRWQEMVSSARMFKALLNSPIHKIGAENPIPHKHALQIIGRKYDQLIQPWQFGHGETKATCLWLKNLPRLTPTNVVDGREQRIHLMSPGEHRGRERSRSYPGIAKAMAEQWGKL